MQLFSAFLLPFCLGFGASFELLQALKEKEKAEKLKQKMSSAGVGGSEPIIKAFSGSEWVSNPFEIAY